MGVRNNIIRVACLLLCSGVLYAQETDVHLVKRGETFSQIARKYFGKPVYRADGSLSKLKRLNPGMNDVNRIFPGQLIEIGPRSVRIPASNSLPLREDRDHTSAQLADAGASAAGAEKISPAPPAAVPATAPRAEAKAQTNKEQDSGGEEEIEHRLSLAGGYAMTTLSASDPSTGAIASLYSSHDLNLQASWSQQWTDTFSTSFSGQVRSIDFSPSTNSSKSISETKKINTALSVLAEQRLSPKLSLSYGASYGSKLFLRGMNSSTVTVDAVPIPAVQVGAQAEVFHKGKTSVGVKASGEYLFSATTDAYSVESGRSYQGALYVRRRYGRNNVVELNLGYHARSQNTSLVNFQEKSVFGALTFSFPLFEGDGK